MKAYPYGSSEWDILSAMSEYGGGFVKKLADLYRWADMENKRILETAFEKYFRKYDAFVGTSRDQAKETKMEKNMKTVRVLIEMDVDATNPHTIDQEALVKECEEHFAPDDDLGVVAVRVIRVHAGLGDE